MIMKSFLYVMEKHKGQKRMGGKPYVTHPIEVADMLEKKGFDWTYVQTALFHDLLEDTDATEDELLHLSSDKVVRSVKLLTKTKGYKMESYIKAIEEDDVAKTVKLADRIHNLLSAVIAKDSFKKRYIEETERYYIDLSEGTMFEKEMKEALTALKETLTVEPGEEK